MIIGILIGFYAGVIVTLLAGAAMAKRLLRMARFLSYLQEAARGGGSATSKSRRSSVVPRFETPIMLDKERVAEVGYAQAVREEAARIARNN